MQASGSPDRMRGLLRGPAMSRLTTPSDANVYGNVHGGTILKMMEEAGTIIATRYCNNVGDKRAEPCYAVLVRIERMDFLLPMMIGEVAELATEIVFTSPRSLLVEIDVQAEDIISGMKHRTNYGRFWYVPVAYSPAGPKKTVAQSVPPMVYASDEQHAAAEAAYKEQKEARRQTNASISNGPSATNGNISVMEGAVLSLPETVGYSRTCLSILVGKSDVALNGYCRGGVMLKLMDECAGIASAKHCRSNVVTACLHATNFHQMVKLGALVMVCGHVTFTSPRSLEVEVVVEFEVPFEHGFNRQRAVDAFFTYVSIDKNGKAQPVPPLKISSEVERKQFESGQQRYDARKRKQQQQQLLKQH